MGVFSSQKRDRNHKVEERRGHPCSNNWISQSTVYRIFVSYVSKVTRKLDEEVRKFFDRPLDDDFIYLFLDGIVIKVKEVSCSVKRIVLVAYGIRGDGSRELIDFRVGKHEGKGAWTIAPVIRGYRISNRSFAKRPTGCIVAQTIVIPQTTTTSRNEGYAAWSSPGK